MSMQTVYLTCMAGGILLLLSSIVFSAFDDFFDLAAFDVCSIDLGEFDLDILPVSMKSLCLAATVFGSVSMLLIDQPAAIRHVIAGVCAYIGAFIVQNITGFLKNHQSEADTIESICSRSFVSMSRFRSRVTAPWQAPGRTVRSLPCLQNPWTAVKSRRGQKYRL